MEEKDHNTPTFSDSPENPTSGGGGGGGAEVGSTGGGSGSGSGYLLSGKKRGRPRKYDAEGNLNPAYVASAAKRAAASQVGSTPAGGVAGFTLTMPPELKPKKGRGRGSAAAAAAATSPTSPNWQPLSPLGDLFSNSGGVDFTPYVVTVQTGEDVAAKIHMFCQKGPRGICILSAIGAISNVTIRQPGSSGGLLTYEGRFEILSLNGSYTVTEAGGVTSKNGGLSISLAGPDGRVVGGSVAGWLTAASPTQVVIGSFVPSGGVKQKRKYHRESSNASAIPAVPETMAAANQNTQGGHNTEAGGPGMYAMPSHSPNEGDDSYGSGHNHNVGSSHNTPVWNDGSERLSDHRSYPDINVSVPGV